MNLMDSCDGGTIAGSNINQKLANVLNYSSSVLVPRGENHEVDALERLVSDSLGLPRTNAYHTQLVKYEESIEVE